MLIRKAAKLKSSEITPKEMYLNRRQLMLGASALATGLGAGAASGKTLASEASSFSTDEALTARDVVTSYNNFYEFGTSKEAPAANAHTLTTAPWSVKIDGMVDRPADYALEDLMAPHQLEERIYRLRCVEGWSMVIPWVGVELNKLLDMAGVQSGAKYVAFETLVRPEEMPGQSGLFQPLPWPYVEGLRLDEAMHPLTIMANGLYGEELPNQNGAPLRLVVPWKYGFKSIKSVVRITLTDNEPPATWNIANAREYGFYSNVNPDVDHPRWSQATERPIGGGLFAKRKETLMFNGYGDEVAGLYEGMDLRKFF